MAQTKHDVERSGTGRRKEDNECVVHEERMDTIDKEISSNKGWLKGASTLIVIVGFVLSSFCTIIMARLTTITDMLTDYRVMIKTHDVEILSIKADITEIKARHIYEEQNNNRK